MKSVKTEQSDARSKQIVLPASLTETSLLAVLRIVATALLFAVMAFWGLAKMRHFSEEYILKYEVASFRTAVNQAQVFAVQNRQTVRLVLSEVEKDHIYRFEKLARGNQYYHGIPMGNEDHAYGKDSRNWSPVEPAERHLLSLVDVSVGSLTTLYMFSDSSCANGWPLPYLYHGTTKMKTEAVRFSLGQAVDTVIFTENGLMPAQ
ncbi:MAG: hypothetical protein A2W80_02365 [Candidatus Riflebacteria bacterium GWC2_50_8]|nr:MAG: hypothetical protein A2W80_02365 [Candidatus Riflebacteria bacterium GWC2_50_8]